MVRASVSLQLHGRTRKGQEIGKRGAEKERERRARGTTRRVLIPFLSLHLLPRVSMAIGEGNAESRRSSTPVEE